MTTSIITTTTFTFATGFDIQAQVIPVSTPISTPPVASPAVEELEIPDCLIAAHPRCAWTARKRCSHTASCKS